MILFYFMKTLHRQHLQGPPPVSEHPPDLTAALARAAPPSPRQAGRQAATTLSAALSTRACVSSPHTITLVLPGALPPQPPAPPSSHRQVTRPHPAAITFHLPGAPGEHINIFTNTSTTSTPPGAPADGRRSPWPHQG